VTEYTLHTADTQFRAEHIQTDPSDANNRTRGDTATFDIHLSGLGDLVVPSGDTYTVSAGTTEIVGDVDLDGTLVIEDTATLIVYGIFDNDGTLINNVTPKAFSNGQLGYLLGYDRHSGSYTLRGTLNHTQRYKERLPDAPNRDSLVVGIEPSDSLEDRNVIGKWGLISNVTDSRTRALTNPVVTVEVDILADYDEYSTISDVQNALAI